MYKDVWVGPVPCAQQLARCTILQSAPISATVLQVIICSQIVIVELVNKEQNCKHLCIVSIHECNGIFLTLYLIYFTHSIIYIHHTYVTLICITHAQQYLIFLSGNTVWGN